MLCIQPRAQSLQMLSGGQQALAALALTLGMRSVFPCPFYFVDEIDASLDTVTWRIAFCTH